MLFSERHGYATLPDNLKPDEISDALRNSLWNVISEWKRQKDLYEMCYLIWKDFLKKPTDTIPYSSGYTGTSYDSAWKLIRDFYFDYDWHRVYSFIEFLFTLDSRSQFPHKINEVLIKEVAAFRVVSNQFVQITDQHEIEALTERTNIVSLQNI